MAKPNYDFAKRQRELSKAHKKEAKRLKKLGPAGEAEAEAGAAPGAPETTAAPVAEKPATE